MNYTNKEFLALETKGINITDEELEMYFYKVGLDSADTYSNENEKKILKVAVLILESIANQPDTMKDYKNDDGISVTKFADNLHRRIQYLNGKIQELERKENSHSNSSVFYMFDS
ncbi:hypothetical protein [Alkalihalobacillus sp. 1P02AB]|uniref:hypothetical protein n=1 Tax=Alkalihalobacillus sp. 1P02AB TaxID=3132260 RepID=UPI0039A6F8A4